MHGLAQAAGIRHGQSRHRRRRSDADRAPRISTRLANAPSIAAPATASSSRPTSRRACSPIIAGPPARSYAGSVLATNLKVSGVPVFSAGDFEGRRRRAPSSLRDPRGTYRKLVRGRWPSRRRGAGRRYRRRALVSRSDRQRRRSKRSARDIAFGRARYDKAA